MDAVHNTTDGPVDFPNGRPGNMIIFYHCSNMLFRDITFRNPPSWTVQIEQIQGAVIDSIHILNDVRIPNNDGVHCIYCHNAHFTNSEIRAGDDSFAIDHSTDVTIDNCTLTSHSSAIRMEDTRDSAFTNLTMHSNRGIGIYDRGKGKTESVVFSNITIDSRLLWGHWWGKGEGIFVAVGEPDGHIGSITRVSFSNIAVDAENGIQLQGTQKGAIGDITFDNVSLRMRIPRPEVQAAVGGNFDTRWTVDDFKGAVFKHDIPAFYAHYVNGLNIHGLDIQWAGAMPAYYTSALDFEDVDNVTIDRFRGRQANVGSQFPVIDLNRVKGISIRDSSATAGSSTFLSTNEVTGERLFEGNDLSDAAKSFNSKTSFTMYGNLLPEKKN
jgi:polygalacturonase